MPIVAVAGSNGKTTTTHLIDRMLREAGYQVGMCTTFGVYHNGRAVARGDSAGYLGVLGALRCPGVQVIVAETGRGGILRNGLGFGTCRVSVVTNVLPDHLGSEGIVTIDQLAEVKSTVPRHTDPHGTVVLNADDPRVAAMAGVSPARPTYFTLRSDANGLDRCWFVRHGEIWRRADGHAQVFMPVHEVPLTLGGLQRHHVANVLAALAVVDGIGDLLPVPDAMRRNTLRRYAADPEEYPDRFTLARYRGHYVLLAHCKNPDSFRIEMPLILAVQAALGCQRLVAVVSGPGDRLPQWYADISRQLAAACDGVFVFPPSARLRRGMTEEDMVKRYTDAVAPERVLGTTRLSPEDTIARASACVGDSFLLWYSEALFAEQMDVESFMREADIVPLTGALLRQLHEVRTTIGSATRVSDAGA